MVAAMTSFFIKRLISKTNYTQTFHFIGHSLGAQISGLTAKDYKKETNDTTRIRRITGLDPAGPHFLK